MKEQVKSGKVIHAAPHQISGTRNRLAPLVKSPFFVVEMFELKEQQTFHTADETGKSSAQILVAVEGCAVVEADAKEPVTLAKGDAVVVPACQREFRVRPQSVVELLKSAVPGGPVAEPEVRI